MFFFVCLLNPNPLVTKEWLVKLSSVVVKLSYTNTECWNQTWVRSSDLSSIRFRDAVWLQPCCSSCPCLWYVLPPHPTNKLSMSPPDYQMCKNIMNVVSFLPYFSIPDWMGFPSLGFEGHWQLKLLPVWASACLSIHLLPVLWSALRCHCFRLTWSALLLFLLCYNDAQTFTYNPLYSQGLYETP